MDTIQQVGEQRLRDGRLGALEDCPPGVTHHLGTDLDELELYASKRPVRDLSRQGEAAEEVLQTAFSTHAWLMEDSALIFSSCASISVSKRRFRLHLMGFTSWRSQNADKSLSNQ